LKVVLITEAFTMWFDSWKLNATVLVSKMLSFMSFFWFLCYILYIWLHNQERIVDMYVNEEKTTFSNNANLTV